MDLVKILSDKYMKSELPEMNVGDTVRVLVRVKEGNRERTQAFEGTIIAKKHGGINETITVRRISYGVGCEKVFPVHQRDHHRAPHLLRRRLREGISGTFSLHRLRDHRPQGQGPPREALLPARPHRQERQGQRASLKRHEKRKPFEASFFRDRSKSAEGFCFGMIEREERAPRPLFTISPCVMGD